MATVDSAAKKSSTVAVQPAAVQSFRFSLLTLLGLMTVAAVACAVLFSRQWHADERLLMAFWYAGLLIGTSFGRARGTHGIYSGALGAVVGCLLVPLLFETMLFPRSGTSTYEAGLLAPYLMFVVVCGWILAVIATSIYHAFVQGTIERWCQKNVTVRELAIVSCLIALALVTWQMFANKTWQPRAEVTLPAKGRGASILTTVCLSANGQQLVASAPLAHILGDPVEPRFYQWTGSRLQEQTLKIPLVVGKLTISPDGRTAAVTGTTLFGGDDQAISLVDLQQNIVTREVKIDIPSFASVSQVCFNSAGTKLIVTSTSPRIQRLHVIDLETFTETTEVFPFVGHLYCSPSGNVLVKIIAVGDETDESTAELVTRGDEQVLHRLTDVRLKMTPCFSNDEQQIALGNRVWNRATGQTKILSGEIVGFTARGPVVTISKNLRQVWPKLLPTWLMQMPFVRQLHSATEFGRLTLVDVTTDQIILTSDRQMRLQRASISADGRVVATCAGDGAIRIWQVPDGR